MTTSRSAAADPEVRRSGLGGSDCAVVFGLNPYRTPFQLYLEKVGEVPPADLSDNEAVYWGTALEDLVAQRYAERMEVRVRRNNRTLRHQHYPFMMAHLDREVVGQDVILECKTAGEYMSGQWGEEFTSQVPPHYLLQCLHYLVVTGKPECHLAVLIGGNKHRIYVIKACDFVQEITMIPITLERFWQRVIDRDPPGATNADDLALMFPTHREEVVQASQQVLDVIAELRDVRASLKALGQREKDLKFDVANTLGAASTLAEGDTILATYRGQVRTSIDQKLLRAKWPDVAEQCEKKTTTRTLLLKGEKD